MKFCLRMIMLLILLYANPTYDQYTVVRVRRFLKSNIISQVRRGLIKTRDNRVFANPISMICHIYEI